MPRKIIRSGIYSDTQPKRKVPRLSARQIQEKFGNTAKCRVSYRQQKTQIQTTLDKVDWKNAVALTIMFPEPKCYIIDGEACNRPGVRVTVKQ